jgi:hypothetical protein
MDIQEALELLGEVVSSGAKTGFDEDAINQAWGMVYQVVTEHADFDAP